MTREMRSWDFIALVRKIDKPKAGIAPSAAHVLTLIAEHCNPDGVSWPSQERLALESGLGSRTVKRAVAWLRSMGLIEVTVRRRHAPNRYRLVASALAALPMIEMGHRGPSSASKLDQSNNPDGPPAPGRRATLTTETGRSGPLSLREQINISHRVSLSRTPQVNARAFEEGEAVKPERAIRRVEPDLNGCVSLGALQRQKNLPATRVPFPEKRKTEAELQEDERRAYETDPALRRCAKRLGRQ